MKMPTDTEMLDWLDKNRITIWLYNRQAPLRQTRWTKDGATEPWPLRVAIAEEMAKEEPQP